MASVSVSGKRCHRLSLCCSFPFLLALWILLVTINGCQTRNLFALAQSSSNTVANNNNSNAYCYDDLYGSDGNVNGKVDAKEYVDFVLLRLGQRRSEDGYFYDVSEITSFGGLPFALQSNFYALACLCSRFQFDNNSDQDNSSCCVGDKAHISVVTAGSALGVEETMSAEKIMYATVVCDFTGRAIDDIISTLEIIQPLPTLSPTGAPAIVTPTKRPTKKPTERPTNRPTTLRPTPKPTFAFVTPSNSPTISPAPSSSSSSLTSSLTSSIVSEIEEPAEVAMVNITIKPSYSILVQDNGSENDPAQQQQQQMSIEDDLIVAMDMVSDLAVFKLWSTSTTGYMSAFPTVFHRKVFLDFATTIDNIVDVGFTSNPKLTEVDLGSDSTKNINTVFAGGPCPIEMMTMANQPKNTNSIHRYRCQEVTASIVLQVELEILADDAGTKITTESVHDLYSQILRSDILRGNLGSELESVAPNSTVTIATGQTVSLTTPRPNIRIGILVALVAGSLLLVVIVVQFIVWATTRDKRRKERKKIHASAPVNKNTIASDDLEARIINPTSEELLDSNQKEKVVAGGGDKSTQQITDTIDTFAATNSRLPLDYNEDDDSRVMINSIPYFPTSPGSIASTEDGKSTGGVSQESGISQESEAGWSEAYTSSMGSLSEDDGLSLPDLPPAGPTTLASIAQGAASDAIERGGGDHAHGASPTADIQSASPTGDSQTTPTVERFTTPALPSSPTSPETIRLLEETISDDDDDFMVHEDSSDDDVGDNNDNSMKNGHTVVSKEKQSPSPEEFRYEVLALIERVVPEEIDQIDDMISQFKNREDELIETLLAMEKRAASQKLNEQYATPSLSPGGMSEWRLRGSGWSKAK